ncbi:MAG: polyphenol oxidase family protein [Candidatus Eisenbacteria bacterium]|nr:polyphenol oxidase family protein [Candidatus Eisenbacteria bacterium]
MELSWRPLDKTTREISEGTTPAFYAVLAHGGKRSPAIVTTRGGRPDTHRCQGLNLSFNVGDDTDDVRDNREFLFNKLGLREDRLAQPEQVHGGTVLLAGAPGRYKAADGLVISDPRLWTAVLVADCVPVFVFNRDFSVVGLAHAGRKGTHAGIAGSLIEQVKSAFDLPPGQLVVALGPSIGPCCYEIDSTTASGLRQTFVTEREGKIFFDLWSANAAQALEEGVPEESIILPPACTCCRKDVFFSHRGQRGKAGRQMAITRHGGLEIGRDRSSGASQ